MLSEKLKQELQGLRFEIIDLNQSSYFYVRKMNRMDYVSKETGREYILEELFALRYLENGIILHLTNLDDDKSKYSLRSAHTLINKSNIVKDQKVLKKLNAKIDEYRKSVNKLKTKHRNSRIAHINSTVFPKLDEFLNFESYLKPLIELANEIGDFIWGEEIDIKFKLGSHEGVLDFRKKNKNLKIDLSQHQDFF
jgi:hypothetical protein